MYKLWGKIKAFFADEYFRSHIILWLLVFIFLVNLTNWILLKIFIKPIDFPIILHYNVYFGVDMLGSWKQVYFLPALGLLLLIINLFLSFYFYKKKDRIASYILMIAALMIQLSLLVASASVIIINY